MSSNLIKQINTLNSKVLILVPNVTIEELNNFENKSKTEYDPSFSFRLKVKEELKCKIINLYAVYYQGWEMDEWAADVVIENKMYHVGTNHGNLEKKILAQK